MAEESIIPLEIIESKIYLIRGQKVMLDSELAQLYQTSTSQLNQQVRRNIDRFPGDFMFELSDEENQGLISQIVISNVSRGGRRKLPLVFTEQGVAMLSSVLHSPRAVQVNIAIMRTFVQLRRMLASNTDLAKKLDELEKKYDQHFAVVFKAIKQLMKEEDKPKREMGFRIKST